MVHRNQRCRVHKHPCWKYEKVYGCQTGEVRNNNIFEHYVFFASVTGDRPANIFAYIM